MAKMKIDYFPFKGGLDTVTPHLSMPPGHCLGCQNYEIGVNEGYRRIDGYERYDGLPKPSDASYWIVDFDNGTEEIPAGTAVQSSISGATGTTVVASVLESGAYEDSDAVGYVVLYNVVGEWLALEDLELVAGSVKKAEIASDGIERGADNDTLDATYLQTAIESTRTSISPVPGSGEIRGVWTYDGDVYAFSDNIGITAVDMYKSSYDGWTLCDLGFTLDFDTGTAAFVVDETVTGAGGATGVVKKVVVESGAWADSDAAGYLVLYSRNGSDFVHSEALTGNIAGAATADGAGAANTFSTGGRFEFVNYNFGGHSSTLKMYGVNGLDKAFEWDGSTFSFLPTGMTTDTPNHIAAHLNYLFLAFSGGSLQHSGIGDPSAWSVVTGAAELTVGDTITGLQVTPGMVMIVFSRNSTRVLHGSSPQDWFLRTHSINSGAIEWTIQQVQETMALDDRGVTRFSRTDTFGDFRDDTVSEMVRSILNGLKDSVKASVAVKDKNQYILFFDDGVALQCTFKDRKLMGFMKLVYDATVECIVAGEDSSGDEQIFFGSDDGYVYELNKGTSFDGAEINAFLRLAYNHFGSPRYWKRFQKVFLELSADTDPNVAIEFAPDFSYSDPDIPSPSPETQDVTGGGGFWDGANWNQFYWSGQAVATLETYIDGIGVNMGLLINSDGTYDLPHTMHGAIVHYHLRGMKK